MITRSAKKRMAQEAGRSFAYPSEDSVQLIRRVNGKSASLEPNEKEIREDTNSDNFMPIKPIVPHDKSATVSEQDHHELGIYEALHSQGDLGNFALLLILYILQGIPMGLRGSISFILQNKHVTYKDQGVFSLVSWPFSLKLLWAPIVDSIFNEKWGRRKSWLIPIQLLCGATMVIMSVFVDELVGNNPSEHVDVYTLTYTFFFLYFLMSTQDIAVDGWALTMLSEKNVGYASTANSVGQTLGYFMSNIVFIAFNSPHFCNFFRSVPSDEPFMTLSGFMMFWGWVFLIITFIVWLLKHEKKDAHATENVLTAYKQMIQVMRLRNVQFLAIIMLTCQFGFSASESIAHLKLIEKGVPTEYLAMLGVAMVPFSVIFPMIVGRYSSGPNPMSLFMTGYPPRLFVALLSVLIVHQAPSFMTGDEDDIPYTFYGIIFCVTVLGSFVMNIMFVSQMAFFAKVSDPVIGGTYMTLLNTLANLGAKWPQTLALFLVDPLTQKTCMYDDQRVHIEDNCVIERDGFDILVGIGVVLGMIWYMLARKMARSLENEKLSSWKISNVQYV